MGRHQKVTADEVEEFVEENGPVTIKEVSSNFEVHPATIRSRLNEVRGEKPVIHNKNGVRIITRDMIENGDQEVIEAMYNFTNWLAKTLKSLHRSGKPIQPLLPALRRALKEALTKEERKELASSCLKMKMLVEWTDAQSDIED